ncbi:MAG TPA: adenylate/guanylate cyclase domain-containing protein [Patescibacteria group bacterium]|nr:adenylate/guanylate cyclase domain-containing protein [Patescibacteria group bacterium]
MKNFRGLIIGLVIFILLSFLFVFGFFGTWQNKLSDTLFTQKSAPNNIVIVAIDDASINQIGRFPWDRSVYANLLNKLNKDAVKPQVIGIDITFSETSNPKSDGDFATALKNYSNTKIVLSSETNGVNILSPINELKNVSATGYANTIADSDGVVRKIPESEIDGIKSFATEISGKSENGNINFIGNNNSFTTYSFNDILDGKISDKNLNNKIVLIGSTAVDLHDDQIVPTSPAMNGVEIQANIINTILTNGAKNNESKLITLFTLLIICLVASIIFINLSPVVVFISGILMIVIYAVYVIFSFDNGTIRNIVFPIFAIIISCIADTIYKYLTESRQRKFLKQTFGFYLSKSVLEHLIQNPHKIKLGGESKELTVLFSDIASFTSISEKLTPTDLAKLLNSYLTKMTNVIFENRGVLDKYIGDAIMAFWGAPEIEKDHAYLACVTALAMQEEIKKNFDFSARVGINTGEMVVGNMGSEQRFDYSLLGDNVNLGSRLEGINKYYGTKICISENTYKKVEGRVVARKLDDVAVKGKSKGVSIYELRALGEPKEKEKIFLEEFEEARKIYEKGDFKKALTAFKVLVKKYSEDGPILMYIERIKELIANPPSEWDGVYHATAK